MPEAERNMWGFRSVRALEDHFLFHCDDQYGSSFCGFATIDDYGAAAFAFLKGEKTDDVDECARSNGQTVRYHRVTQEFGVLSPSGYIVTYYRKDPRRSQWPTNAAYFRKQCQQ